MNGTNVEETNVIIQHNKIINNQNFGNIMTIFHKIKWKTQYMCKQRPWELPITYEVD